ncbi:MAG: phage tail family protein [Defluviitaleaceae bacterium]|nr:phage tail family protein [Defluviitaleaceae bacterium]
MAFGYTGQIILEHLDMGEVAVERQSSRGIGQDGVNELGRTIGTRVLTARCCIIGVSEEDRFDVRRRVGRVLNPHIGGHLVYNNGFRDYKIECGLGSSVDWGEMLPNRRMQRFEAQFFCPSPFLLDLSETMGEFLEVTPRLQFPLRLRVPGFLFSSLAGGQIAVENAGDAPSPLRMVIFGPCLNPSVTNQTTGEGIRILHDLRASENIEITTHFGNKRITLRNLEGQEENIMHRLDMDAPASFFSLRPGLNLLKFGADVGEDIGRMNIYFSPRYLIV